MQTSDAKVWLKKKILRENPVFRDLDDATVETLIRYAQTKMFSEGETVYKKGELAKDTFCIIVFGSAKIVDDKGKVIRVMKSSELIGEIGITSPQQKRTADVIAVEATSILEWTFSEIKDKSPSILKKLKDVAIKNLKNYY